MLNRQIEQMQAVHETDRQDAKRYRWLRNHRHIKPFTPIQDVDRVLDAEIEAEENPIRCST